MLRNNQKESELEILKIIAEAEEEKKVTVYAVVDGRREYKNLI